MEKCPCEKCIVLAICKPKMLVAIDDDEVNDLPRTKRNLATKFLFDMINYSYREYNCPLLQTFLEYKVDINDQGKTTYSIKTKKIEEFAKAMGIDINTWEKK